MENETVKELARALNAEPIMIGFIASRINRSKMVKNDAAACVCMDCKHRTGINPRCSLFFSDSVGADFSLCIDARTKGRCGSEGRYFEKKADE